MCVFNLPYSPKTCQPEILNLDFAKYLYIQPHDIFDNKENIVKKKKASKQTQIKNPLVGAR